MDAMMTVLISHPWIAALVGLAFLAGWHRLRRRSLLVVGVLWIHAAYEVALPYLSACGDDCNIRVDLLLIYPILLVAAIVAIVAALRARR